MNETVMAGQRENIARAAVAATASMCAVLGSGIPCAAACDYETMKSIEAFIVARLSLYNGLIDKEALPG